MLALFGVILFALFAMPVGAQEIKKDVLVKGPGQGAAVYYLANDGKRYVFPNQKVFLSWFADFSGVVEVRRTELAAMPLGGNVTYRPGIRMVKITTDPKTYAVDSHGTLRLIASEDVAAALYGSHWKTLVDDMPDTFFVNYKVGSPVYSVSDFSPEESANAAVTLNADLSLEVTPDTGKASSVLDTGDVVRRHSSDIVLGKVVITGPVANDGTAASAQPAEPVTLTATSKDVRLGEFVFKDENEALVLRKVRFAVKNAAALSDISLYDGDRLIGGPFAVPALGTVDAAGISFAIPLDASSTLTVRGTPNWAGFVSGNATPASVTLLASDLDIRGAAPWSTTVITALNQPDVPGDERVLTRTKVSLVSEPLPGKELVPGEQVASRFTVRAEGADPVLLRAVRVSFSCNVVTGVTVQAAQTTVVKREDDKATDDENKVSGSTSGDPCTTGLTTRFYSDEVIEPGTSRTYDLSVLLAGKDPFLGDHLTTRVEGLGLFVTLTDSTDGSAYEGVISAAEGLPSAGKTLTRQTYVDPSASLAAEAAGNGST